VARRPGCTDSWLARVVLETGRPFFQAGVVMSSRKMMSSYGVVKLFVVDGYECNSATDHAGSQNMAWPCSRSLQEVVLV
jgi:hypothetical protein